MKLLTTLSCLLILFACDYSHTASEESRITVITDVTPADVGLFIQLHPASKTSDSASIIRSRTVKIDTTTLTNILQAEQVTTLPLNFFNDAIFTVTRLKQTLNQSGSITWLGTLPSVAGSIAVINITEDTVNGSLDIPNKGLFSVRSLPDGDHLVEEISRSAVR